MEAPSVQVTVSPENPKVGDEVTITISTDAQYLSLFTGDEGKMFERSRIKAIMENDWNSFYEKAIGFLMRRMERRHYSISISKIIRLLKR